MRGIQKTSRQKSNHLLMALGSILFLVGCVGFFAPELLSFLPASLAVFVAGNALFLLIAGLGLESIKIYSLLQRARQKDEQPQRIDSSPLPAWSQTDNQRGEDLNSVNFDASKVKWSPAKKGGTNITSHRLRVINVNRLEVFATWQLKVFALVFALFGGSIGLFMSMKAWQQSEGLVVLFPAGIGFIFVAVGAGLFWSAGKVGVFDRSQGWYWRDRAAPKSGAEQRLDKVKEKVRLGDIQALQLLTEQVSGSKGSSYKSYELNLILDNNDRINVMDHGSKRVINESAVQLGQFLKVPVIGEL